MENKDEYIMEDNGFTLVFLKNGVIHREDGPAMLWKHNSKIEHYLNLGDEHLYTIKKTKTYQKKVWKDSQQRKHNDDIFYFLDGRPLPKDDFELELKKIQIERIKSELNNELSTQQTNYKQSKI